MAADDLVEPEHRSLAKRQESIDAEEFLDREIDYLIATMYDVVDQGILKTEAHQRIKVIKLYSLNYMSGLSCKSEA